MTEEELWQEADRILLKYKQPEPERRPTPPRDCLGLPDDMDWWLEAFDFIGSLFQRDESDQGDQGDQGDQSDQK